METPDPVWMAEIHNGKLVVEDRNEFRNYCMALTGFPLEVIVRKFRKRKDGSDQQRGYYWAVIVRMISDYTGDDEESVHETMTVKFAPWETYKGKRRRVRYSKMSTVQREEYQEKCRVWAIQFLSLNVPLPNQVDY